MREGLELRQRRPALKSQSHAARPVGRKTMYLGTSRSGVKGKVIPAEENVQRPTFNVEHSIMKATYEGLFPNLNVGR
jgi:hypothetical protein